MLLLPNLNFISYTPMRGFRRTYLQLMQHTVFNDILKNARAAHLLGSVF